MCLQCGLKWVCMSYKYNHIPNIAMLTNVHGKYILYLRQSWRTYNIIIDFLPYFVIDIEECNMTWITLYFEERILNVLNNRQNFVVFVATYKNKTKNIEGLVHVRVVRLSCPTRLSPWTGGQCFLHHLIPWWSVQHLLDDDYVVFLRNKIHFIDIELVQSSLKISHLLRGSWQTLESQHGRKTLLDTSDVQSEDETSFLEQVIVILH